MYATGPELEPRDNQMYTIPTGKWGSSTEHPDLKKGPRDPGPGHHPRRFTLCVSFVTTLLTSMRTLRNKFLLGKTDPNHHMMLFFCFLMVFDVF